jgi:DUF4097 and DUF4098 domain-containing protein YvlB
MMTTLGAVLVSTAFLTTMSAAKDQREELNQVYEVGKSPSLSLSNLNGAARITGWDRSTIEVKAVKSTSGSRERLDDATVKFDMKDDHLRIQVEYEDDGGRNNDDFKVEFEIHVPRGTRVDTIKLVNGDLDVSGITAEVEASAVNGDVTGTQLTGAVQLSTVNGDVSLTNIAGGDPIQLKSVNGSVTIVLPGDINAKLSASTVHGDISGDFEHGFTYAGLSMDVVLGSGGTSIDLDTVNGDIRIRRADSNDSRKPAAHADSDDDSE